MTFVAHMDLGKVRLSGHDHFWTVIRDLDLAGSFSISDVVGQTSAHSDTVADFLRRLVRAGIAANAGWRSVRNPKWSGGKFTRARLYRLLQRPQQTPSLRRDGTPGAYGAGRQAMWNILRGPQARGGIDAKELVMLAETPGVPISLGSAKEYLLRLEKAGYLAVLEKAAQNRLTQYRMRPAMNTGALAPKLLRAYVVYDANRRVMVGEAVAEEVSP